MRYIILFLMLAAVGMGDVYLRKSEFTDNYWQAYIPADDTGEYWLQVGFGTPVNDDLYLPYFTILDMTYGKLCDAEQIPGIGSDDLENAAEITGAAAWDPQLDQANGDFNYLGENQNPATPLTIDLPDTHNEVHILYWYSTVGDPSQLTIDWSDGSTTDLLETDLGADYATSGIRELVILKGVVVGTRTLRLVSGAGAGYTKLIGIRSWDTNTTGDLSSDSDDCLITQLSQVNQTGELCTLDPSATLGSTNTAAIGPLATIGKAFEWGVIWDSGGTTYETSGGNNHLAAVGGNNPYVMAAGYLAGSIGPEIWVDEVAADNVYDNTNNLRGGMLSGNVITIRSNGTLTGQTAGTAPDCEWIFVIDKTGISSQVSITWNSGIVFQTPPAIYTPELPMNTTFAGNSSFRWPSSNTLTEIPVGTASDVTYTGRGSSCEIVCDSPDFLLRMLTFTPASRWVYANSGNANKFYGGSRGGFAGNTTPAAGDVLVLGGKYEVRKLNSNGSESWQGITGGGSSGATYKGLYGN